MRITGDSTAFLRIEAGATGVLAVRFDTDGELDALAGSEIRHFKADCVEFDLSALDGKWENLDIALWRADGGWKGGSRQKTICQNRLGELPPTGVGFRRNSSFSWAGEGSKRKRGIEGKMKGIKKKKTGRAEPTARPVFHL